MRLKNDDLIKFLMFNDVANLIILEFVLNIQVETIPFQLNNKPLDTLFFPNEKTVISTNANENDSFPLKFNNKHRSDLLSTKSIDLSTRINFL
jgi:hypothetical protein